tara:strand:+ start:473 stop:610 length:138 start_codon:yes stop_codon:yes gene_type:complete
MGKGMTPKKGYNDKLYKDNYDSINWNSNKISNEKNKSKNNGKKGR